MMIATKRFKARVEDLCLCELVSVVLDRGGLTDGTVLFWSGWLEDPIVLGAKLVLVWSDCIVVLWITMGLD